MRVVQRQPGGCPSCTVLLQPRCSCVATFPLVSNHDISPSPYFCDLLNKFLQVRDDLKTELFATIAWCLWNRRNALHFGRPANPMANISSVASTLVQEFIASQVPDIPIHHPPAQHQWRPPEPDAVKVNFDAALFKRTNSAGIGIIVRDWRGVSLAALSMPIPLSSSVADMEALACLRAVQLAAKLEFQCVIFEGDSATVISAVNQGSSLLSSFGNIVDDIRYLLPSFSSATFSHVNRTGNLVADALAKKASSNVGSQVWMNALPSDIAVLVDFDVH